MTVRVFLADLGHNQVTLSSDVYPLGVANLVTYALQHSPHADQLRFSIFREPQDLKAALDRRPPDVLGVSSYAWNHSLSRTLARYAKGRSADTLTLMGGPNFPLAAEDQFLFLGTMPEIDVAVRGPTYEGERAFLNLIDRYIEAGGAMEGLCDAPIAGSAWVDRRSSTLVMGGEIDRIRDLDEIPSPYLSGWMDPYFETGYFPMMQIARGCPFRCTYCNSSVASNDKVFAHSIANVRADLEYIAKRVKPEMTLCLADDNFGMYDRDEEIAEYLSFLQDRYGWPRYVRTTTGKNRGERIIRVMRKARNMLPMTAAVQSMNPEVLKNIERSNIKLETFADIQKEVQAQGAQAYGELILNLPGETMASFRQAIRDLLGTGVQRVSAHQLMLLHGTPMTSRETRKQFEFQTRFRVVARNLGDYTGEPVIETEEIVVATSTYSFQDYLDTRVFHLLLTIFYYEGNFEEAFAYAAQQGVEPFDVMAELQQRLGEAPEAFREMMDDFVRESREELFETEEACVAWSKENFAGLLDGSIGGNLLSKYSMLGRFFLTHESMTFLEAGIRASLEGEKDRGRKDQLDAVLDYLRTVILHVPFAETVRATPSWTSAYDVEAWRSKEYALPLDACRFASPQTFSTEVDGELAALIESRIATFGEHPAGLGKFTRTVFARDLRRRLVETPRDNERSKEASA